MTNRYLGVPRWFALASLLFLATGVLQAGVIYSTFDNPPGTDFNSSGWYNISGASIIPSGVAAPFTSSGDFTVTQVDLLVGSYYSNVNNVVDVGIYSDASGAPGSLIGSQQALTVANLLGSEAVQSVGMSGVTLQTGEQYWVALLPDTTTTAVGWYVVNQYGGTRAYTNDDGSTWNVGVNSSPYFDVVGDTGGGVPEPGTMALLGAGLGGVALIRRFRVR